MRTSEFCEKERHRVQISPIEVKSKGLIKLDAKQTICNEIRDGSCLMKITALLAERENIAREGEKAPSTDKLIEDKSKG